MSDHSRLAKTIFRQERMHKLHAVIVGAGALGNQVFQTLGLLGTGRITVVDPDVVDPTNLTRSVPFRCHGLIGRNKAEALAEVSRALFPFSEVIAIPQEIADVGFCDLAPAGIIFCCVDSDLARLEVAYISTKLDLPVVDAALGTQNYSHGRVTFFPGRSAACFGCRLTSEKRRELLTLWDAEVHSCSADAFAVPEREFPSTPTMASVVGAMQVELGLRSLIAHQPGGPRKSVSIEITIDEPMHLEKIQVPLSHACPFHDWNGTLTGSPGPATETTVSRLLEAAEKANAPRSALVLDWPLCTEARCLDCGHSWHPMMRIALIRKKGVCPLCNSHRVADQQSVRSLEYGGPWASFTLAQLGLPEHHLHSVRLLSGVT
jgi:adenylyltransferase/sulfurtransferase